jgi:hypothetical protein
MSISFIMNATSITTTSAYLSASWYDATNIIGAIIKCNGQDVAFGYEDVTSLSGGIYGLSPNTTYTATCDVWHEGTVSSTSINFTTQVEAPYVDIPTINSIVVDGLYASINCTKGANNTSLSYELSKADGSGITTFGGTNLEMFDVSVSEYSVNYRIRIQGYFNGTDSSFSPYSYFTSGVYVPNVRPSNWNWSYNIASGENVQNASMSANGSNIDAYIMSANEWNSFTERIDDFRVYKGLSKYFTFTQVTHDTVFTNLIRNQAINAINALGFSIPSASEFASVADLLNTCKDCLNSTI